MSSAPKQEVLEPAPQPKARKTPAKPDVIQAKVIKENKKTDPAKGSEPLAKAAPPKPEKEEPRPDPVRQKPVVAEPVARSISPLLVIAGFALGSVAAGVIGYGIALKTLPAPQDDNAKSVALIKSMDSRVADLENRVATVETDNPGIDLATIRSDLDALTGALKDEMSSLTARVDKAEQQLSSALGSLETSKQGVAETLGEAGADLGQSASELLTRYGGEIESLKSEVAAQISRADDLSRRIDDVSSRTSEGFAAARAKVQELATSAKTAAKQIDLAVARARLRAAVEGGKSYLGALADITATHDIAVPEALGKSAAEGVVSMATLRSAFPAAARKALKASLIPDENASFGQRLGAFLKSQIGARSLDEKDGDDPDAILSRAEAELDRGNLQAAVDLVATLPEPGVAAMNDWLTKAGLRLDVQAALDEFSANLNDQ